MDTEDLRQTVRRAARGDEDAAGALFDHYYPRVYRYASTKVRGAQDAEDIASETFSKVLRSLDRFRWRGAGFEAWLFRIASNVIVDHYRGSGRELADDQILAGALPSGEAGPESLVLIDERDAELRAMISELPEDQQEVLSLRFGGGLDPSEIGRVMGRKANAIRQLQFRALSNLRKKVGE